MTTAVVWQIKPDWLGSWVALDDAPSAQMEDALLNSSARTIDITLTTASPFSTPSGKANFDVALMRLNAWPVRRSYKDPSIAVKFFYLEGPEWVQYDDYSTTLMRDVLKSQRTSTTLHTDFGDFAVEFDTVDTGIVGLQHSNMRMREPRAVRMKGSLQSSSGATEKVVKQIADDPDMPKEFKCPITTMPMSNPVVAADGHSYERRAISKWVILKATSPMTGAPLVDTTFFPNVNLEKLIQDYITKKDASSEKKKKKKKRLRVPGLVSSSSLACTETLDDADEASDTEGVGAEMSRKKACKA